MTTKTSSKMARTIEEIIGKEESECLRGEFNDMICSGANYEDIEDLLMGYGLEMDYVECLM